MDTTNMNKLQLRSACRNAKVPGYSKMRVADMRAALAETTTSNEEPPAEQAEVMATPAKAKRADNVNGVNGKSRPKAGGKCAEVWSWLDKNRNATLKEIKVVAEKKGWNVNNAACELYAHRRFNGISGRVK